MNPFTFGNPIKDPPAFTVGRRRSARSRTACSPRRTSPPPSSGRGASARPRSYITSPIPRSARDIGLTSDKFCLVYTDFQGLTDITPTRFWQRVLKKDVPLGL